MWRFYIYYIIKRAEFIIVCPFTAVNDSRYFIVATGDTVARVSLDGLRYQVLVSGLGNAVAVDYDYRYRAVIHAAFT